uniref:Uncharacterized protein n=1 Tax=Haplochromis burtoni TaxID=8153 RepID=A0A3Q2VIW2_HAPBU
MSFGQTRPKRMSGCTRPNTAHQHTDLVPAVWPCFAVTGSGNPAVIEWIMNSSVYQSHLESNVRPN